MADGVKDQRGESELDKLAFRLYTDLASKMSSNVSDEYAVVRCYQKAQAFLDARERVRSGALDIAKPVGPQLSDVSCPNLPETHPHNVVSQRFGSLAEVNRITEWLEKNPAAEEYNQGRYAWKKQEVKTARVIFPAYLARPVAA